MSPAAAAAEITLRFLAAPTDAGQSGSVSAGRVLEWIDKAGYAAAAGWSGTYAVTAYVGNVRFTRPVEVGELVEVTARVVHTGRTLDAHHGRRGVGPAAHPGDGAGHPVPHHLRGRRRAGSLDPGAARWCRAPRARQLEERWAARRADLRAQVEAAMAGQVYTDAGTAPRVVMRFLAAPTDVNWGGKVHGGIVMRWIDEAAHVLATQWTGSDRNVAIFTGGVRFYRPLADRPRRRGRGPAAAHRAHLDARRGARALGRPVRRARRHGADDLLPHHLRGHRRASGGRCRAPPGCPPTTRTGPWTPTPSSWCDPRPLGD